jgi:hypothetical protein
MSTNKAFAGKKINNKINRNKRFAPTARVARTAKNCEFPQCAQFGLSEISEFGVTYRICQKHLDYVIDRQEDEPFYTLDQEISEQKSLKEFQQFVAALKHGEPASWSEKLRNI